MKIAITGGSGGIGRAVIEMALAQGHSVINLDRVPPPTESAASGVPFIQAEIGDYAALEAAFRGCEALIHLAAIPSPGHHPDHVVHNNNVVGSYNALRAAAEVGVTHIAQASSVNAMGHAYSRQARYDYFPIDEHHPTYNEDPYSLSKWICEQQADSIVRRYENIAIASLRFHWVVASRSIPGNAYQHMGLGGSARHLWAYTSFEAAARACLLGVTANFTGHEAFFIIAPDTAVDAPSLELAQKFHPQVPLRAELINNQSFFDSTKAERILRWKHNPNP